MALVKDLVDYIFCRPLFTETPSVQVINNKRHLSATEVTDGQENQSVALLRLSPL